VSDPLYRSRPTGFDIRPATEPRTVAINDFIHLSEGLSNSYLVVTSEGRVVINTGMGFEAPSHRAAFDAVDGGPVRYILLTQGHVDHVGGVDLFLEEGTEVVANVRNTAHQADDARIHRFRVSRSAFAWADAIRAAHEYIRANHEGAVSGQSRPQPTITFDDEYTFELGGVRFELLATPGGETVDSMVIWLPQHGICFTGNLFSALFGHFPNLVTVRGDRYREAPRFIESLDRVMALDADCLLVGHHQPVRGRELIRSELSRLRGAVEYVHDETVRGMNSGVDVHTLMREIILPRELEVGEGYGKVAWSVRAIWETYAGWFHHESTTELYGVPRSAVNHDLAELAGGAEPLAERARARVAEGRWLEAIHLCEVALAVEPENDAALAASIDAHQALLDRSVNFWETAWLRRQLDQLRSQRG
jgi:alkyl sulfatase BDS1-like metallo-beta-lactamase superfamily hydrolase